MKRSWRLIALGMVGTASLVAVASLAAGQSDPEKLGGYDLPYTGSGSVIYDLEEKTWTIAFQAPAGWPCTELGYSFASEEPATPVDYHGYGPLEIADLLDDEGVLDIHGELRIEHRDSTIFATVASGDEIWSFELLITGELPVENLAEITIPADDGDGILTAADCPGGSCKCTDGGKKCEACCPSGKTPRCSCGNPPMCRCTIDKVTGAVSASWIDVF